MAIVMTEHAGNGVPLPGLHMQKGTDAAVLSLDHTPHGQDVQGISQVCWLGAERVREAGKWQGGALGGVQPRIRGVWRRWQAWHHKPHGALHIMKARR